MTYDVIVIGGGVAGLSAAVRCAGQGARVLVVEGRSRLGGRATSIPDKESGELVDNGQHILAGAYRETFAFLDAIGAGDSVSIQPQLTVPMIDRTGRRSRLSCPSFPPPFNLIAGIFEWDALAWGDRIAALRMAAPLRIARRQLQGHGERIAASPGETVESWLVRNGQTPRLCEMLWTPLALAALNQPAQLAAAPVFVRVLAEMFDANPRSSAIAVPAKPLIAMYAEPAREYIERHGGAVRLGAAATIDIQSNSVASVAMDGERYHAPWTISAVPWFAVPTLFTGDTANLTQLIAGARSMASMPIVTSNLWFDRPVLGEPFVGCPGRPFQWLFERRAGGDAAALVSFVASGASSFTEQSNDEITAAAYGQLLDAIPAARSAGLRHSAVVREPRATFSLAPGQPPRPSAVTSVAGLLLAGDWIDTGLPATIESAVRSGNRAAALAMGTTNGSYRTRNQEPARS